MRLADPKPMKVMRGFAPGPREIEDEYKRRSRDCIEIFRRVWVYRCQLEGGGGESSRISFRRAIQERRSSWELIRRLVRAGRWNEADAAWAKNEMIWLRGRGYGAREILGHGHGRQLKKEVQHDLS